VGLNKSSTLSPIHRQIVIVILQTENYFACLKWYSHDWQLGRRKAADAARGLLISSCHGDLPY